VLNFDDNDHRSLINRLDLAHFQEDAPAMVFWHPRGWVLYQLLERAARAHVVAGGYREVRTPQLLRRSIWEQSGHWGRFENAMFCIGEGADEAAFKPVSCPGHIQLVKRAAPSWRDLPLRIAEFGQCHRDEASGTVHGLMRLRQFTQDDGHVFCAEEHLAGELARFCRELLAFYRRFGIDDVAIALSLRPDDRLGDDAAWDRAEAQLAAAIEALGIPYEIVPGGGAIYGPKVEFLVEDRAGRAWQCGTIQLDFVMPQRFDVRYVDRDGERRHVVMLHRALYGSIERFLGILLERHGAALPAWLAPDQLVVAPIADVHRARAEEVRDELARAGLRVRLEADGTVARRIALAQHDGVPFVVVIGAREVAGGSLAVRDRDRQWSAPASDAIAELVQRCQPRDVRA